MSSESMIATIKAELDNADYDTLNSVLKMLDKPKKPRSQKRKKQDSRVSSTHREARKTSKFIGENLTFEKIKKMTMKERGALQGRLKEQNKEWLQNKFTDLNAFWLMVIDGEVYTWGKRKEFPHSEQIEEITLRTEKYPLIFIDDRRLLIEESRSIRQRLDEEDFYPTIPVTLKSYTGSVELIADFDTGSPYSFVNYEMLLENQAIQHRINEYINRSVHLSQNYEFISKDVLVEMSIDSGKTISSGIEICCVSDWRNSPFVSINPKRTALVERDLLFELKVNVLLEFENNRTKIVQ